MGVEWSSNLEVGWNLEQQKCEMGHPLTGFNLCVAPFLNICVPNSTKGQKSEMVVERLDGNIMSSELGLCSRNNKSEEVNLFNYPLSDCQAVRFLHFIKVPTNHNRTVTRYI